jgi:hypothetical protein
VRIPRDALMLYCTTTFLTSTMLVPPSSHSAVHQKGSLKLSYYQIIHSNHIYVLGTIPCETRMQPVLLPEGILALCTNAHYYTKSLKRPFVFGHRGGRDGGPPRLI